MITTGNIEVPGGRIGSGNAQVFDSSGLVRTMDNVLDRQERRRVLALQEEKARAEAAALAAKKAKDDEVIAEYQVLKGDVFREPLAEIQRQDIEFGRRLFADPRATAYQKQQFIADQKLKDLNRNEWLAAESKNFAEARTRLSPYYDIPATTERDFIQSRIKNDPNFYMKSHAPEFEQAIVSNPYRFKADVMGSELLKDDEKLSVDIKKPDGTKIKKTWSSIVDEPQKAGGDPIINEAKAKALVLKNPIASNWLSEFTKAESQRLIAPDVSPQQAEAMAVKEGINRLFANKVKVDWVEDRESTERHGRNTKASEINIGKPQVIGKMITQTNGKNFEVSTIATPLTSTKEVPLAAGAVVYPLGSYVDKSNLTATPIQGSKAFYLKSNLGAKHFEKVDDVPIATERVELFHKDGSGRYFVEPGEVIAEAVNDPSLLKGITGSYKTENGYFVSPDDTQVVESEEEDENGNKITTYTRKNPKSTSLLGHVFIPERYASSVNNHFKVAPTKTGSLDVKGRLKKYH